MPISVRLPPRVEQRLAEYCAHTKLTRSEAIKRALERLLDEEPAPDRIEQANARAARIAALLEAARRRLDGEE